MQSINEILQTIARQRGRGDALPLLASLPFEAARGERIAHLPIDSELAQAWVALTGEAFRPHQAHALTTLRRGEPVALRAASGDVAFTAYLLLYATLLADPAATALILAPDETLAQLIWGRIAQLNQDLPRAMQLNALPLAPNRRPDSSAQVVITAPAALHGRLLRHHDRGWGRFWPRLQFVMLPEIQQYTGVAGAHLADLLFRIQRVASSHSARQLSLLATMQDVAEADTALATLLGQAWRVIPADDGPRTLATLAIWRGGATWRRDACELASTFQRQGYQVHIVCRALDRPLLGPIIGDLPRVTFGTDLAPAQVLIAAGFLAGHSAVRRMLRSGSQAVVLVLGEQPHEQALARQAQQFASAPNSTWVAPGPNAYILARHVLCAASELPLTAAEVDAWGVHDIVERLVKQGQLVDLPDAEVAWKPTDAAGDPYADWSIRSASGGPYVARNEQGHALGTIEPDTYERWAFPNAALPPGAGGFRVLERDDDAGALTLRLDSSGRRSYPLRRCSVTVRDTREARTLAGNRSLSWGRVVVAEEIYGYREASSTSAPADVALSTPISARWAAPACWFDLNTTIQVQGQFIGWSLAAALQIRALAEFTDVVPCYDHEARRLYLADAQPGGNGLSAWLYANAEELLPLAYDVALACRSDPLLEPLSRVDMDWLLLLLGRQAADAPAQPAALSPRHVEYVEAPPELLPPSLPAAAEPEPPLPLPEAQPPPRRSRAGQPASEVAPPARTLTPAPNNQHALPLWDQAGAEPPSLPPEQRGPTRRSEQAGRSGDPVRPARRDSSAHGPPAQPPVPPIVPAPLAEAAPPAPEPAPDAQALIERLRRQRQQREAQLGLAGPPARTPRAPASFAADQRFAAGDRVFCLPYGDGEVRESRVEAGRELLEVHFPDLGELTIDPLVNLVRKLGSAAPPDDDLL